MKKSLFALFAIAATSIASAHEITAGFSSDGTAEKVVIEAINNADKQILLAAYSFTNKNIAGALIRANKRGVKVYAVIDKSQLSEKYTAAKFLANGGVPTRIDAEHAIMHNKYMIIDGKTVQTGSFNYTSSAVERNAENVIVITGDEKLARQYTKDWDYHWQHAQELRGNY